MERVSSVAVEEVEESREVISTDQSSRTSKKRAKVWDFVDSEKVDGIEKAVCKYCKIQLSSAAGKGTTHLNRHISHYCPLIPKEDRDRFLATLKNKPSEDHIFDPVVFRRLIAKYFLSVEIAFRKADDPCWRELLNYCQPSFRVVGRQSVRADCILLYEEEKAQLCQKIAKLKCHISLTADMWSSNQNLGYLGVTAHFIDEDFELQKKIIAFKQISFPHKSYAVQDGIIACLMEWGMVHQLFTVTLDNASVNNRAIKNMREALGGQMFFKGEHIHIKYADHVLNIIVQARLQIIPNAVGKVRDIIKVVTYTPSRLQIFNAIVQAMGLKGKSRLILDVPHRWNATHDMLNEALKYKLALNRYATEQYHDVPSEEDWAKAEALHGFLEQFSEATIAFSADRHPTAHIFLKMMMAIRDVLLDETWNCSEMFCLMRHGTRLRRCMTRYYLEYEMIVRCAISPSPVFISSDVQSPIQSGSSPLCGRRRVELAFAEFSSQSSSTRSERSELDAYLNDPRVSVREGENFNVLAWWKKNSDAYPILSLMARDFLSIPVTSVSSESAFSAAGRILGKDRTSLSPETLQALICTKDWLIGYTSEDEGQPMTGQRMFESDDE